mmetsp:Transcript_8764/g.17080  ORF Transcript_8764/g.17080 Transcript_8764/m.17080 type:complete len:317 (+) Transcript_8764:544-1494(+)
MALFFSLDSLTVLRNSMVFSKCSSSLELFSSRMSTCMYVYFSGYRFFTSADTLRICVMPRLSKCFSRRASASHPKYKNPSRTIVGYHGIGFSPGTNGYFLTSPLNPPDKMRTDRVFVANFANTMAGDRGPLFPSSDTTITSDILLRFSAMRVRIESFFSSIARVGRVGVGVGVSSDALSSVVSGLFSSEFCASAHALYAAWTSGRSGTDMDRGRDDFANAWASRMSMIRMEGEAMLSKSSMDEMSPMTCAVALSSSIGCASGADFLRLGDSGLMNFFELSVSDFLRSPEAQLVHTLWSFAYPSTFIRPPEQLLQTT